MSLQTERADDIESFDDLFEIQNPENEKAFAGSEFILQLVRELQQAYLQEKAASGLTQQALASKLGCRHRSIVNRWLLGKENMSARAIGELAWALNRRAVLVLEHEGRLEHANFFTAHEAAPNAPMLTMIKTQAWGQIIPGVSANMTLENV